MLPFCKFKSCIKVSTNFRILFFLPTISYIFSIQRLLYRYWKKIIIIWTCPVMGKFSNVQVWYLKGIKNHTFVSPYNQNMCRMTFATIYKVLLIGGTWRNYNWYFFVCIQLPGWSHVWLCFWFKHHLRYILLGKKTHTNVIFELTIEQSLLSIDGYKYRFIF